MKKFYLSFLALGAIALTFIFTSFSAGSPGGKSGSPGDGGATCTQCHSGGSVIEQAGWITSDIPAEGYTFGHTYMVSATINDDDAIKAGFELTAEDASGNKIGTFESSDGDAQIINNNTAATHDWNNSVLESGTKTWSFEWISPMEDVGEITFYAAFNGTNSNGSTSGDQVYTSMMSFDLNTVGLDNTASNDIKVYPNPATDYVTIDIKQPTNVNIYNINGQIVKQIQLLNSKEQIDISDLEKGNYIIQLPAKNISKKIVIL